MRTFVLGLAVAVASSTAGRALAAQEVPTFHAGEWAAEFSGGNWNSAGVMRFLSPRSALVLSFSGSFVHSSDSPDNGASSTTNARSLNLGLGVRRHRSIAARVLATTELGAMLSYSRQKTEADGLGGPVLYRQSLNGFGIYGEIGGQYFVASHIALGAAGTFNAVRTSGRIEGGTTGTDNRAYSLSTSLRPIRITVYF